MHPVDPVAAVTHPDPYPYYAELVAARPLEREATLGLWVAAGAAAVTAVLASARCRVRPPTEPVPKALVGSPAGSIFGRLVRMNDGPAHASMKQAVSATLASLDAARVAEAATMWAEALADELRPAVRHERLADFAFRLPAYVMASLLGVAPRLLAETAARVGDLVRCLAPGSTPEEVARGTVAAGHLLETFAGRLASGDERDGLLAALAREARRADAEAVAANAIGYLSQAYEATAGLIGNTLLALARHAEAREQLRADPSLLRPLLREVLRWDAPVQNTRRFVAGDGVVAGRRMRAGDAVLVVLAAANRDPAANPRPERLDALRPEPRLFTFGAASHACPGEALAVLIAGKGIERLVASGLALEALAGPTAYRRSANTRIPLFTPPAG